MIVVKDGVLEINAKRVDIEPDFYFQEAVLVSGVVVGLLGRPPGRAGTFRNIRGYSLEGKELWIAEMPTDSYDGWFGFDVVNSEIRAQSLSSYDCYLDPLSGKILRKEWFK